MRSPDTSRGAPIHPAGLWSIPWDPGQSCGLRALLCPTSPDPSRVVPKTAAGRIRAPSAWGPNRRPTLAMGGGQKICSRLLGLWSVPGGPGLSRGSRFALVLRCPVSSCAPLICSAALIRSAGPWTVPHARISHVGPWSVGSFCVLRALILPTEPWFALWIPGSCCGTLIRSAGRWSVLWGPDLSYGPWNLKKFQGPQIGVQCSNTAQIGVQAGPCASFDFGPKLRGPLYVPRRPAGHIWDPRERTRAPRDRSDPVGQSRAPRGKPGPSGRIRAPRDESGPRDGSGPRGNGSGFAERIMVSLDEPRPELTH